MRFAQIKRICGSCFPFTKVKTLLMCWPERDPSSDSKMVTMLKKFYAAGGKTVLVSGTPPNEQGRCYGPQGTQALWDCLCGLFIETARLQVPSFMKVLPDCLVVLKRKCEVVTEEPKSLVLAQAVPELQSRPFTAPTGVEQESLGLASADPELQTHPITAPTGVEPECTICMSKQAIHACVPCGHRVLCGGCVDFQLNECPMCRAAISSIIRIY
jgi:hypothetical protein